MPYKNTYNENIANTVLENNRRLIAHLDRESEELLGSGIHNNASKCECNCCPCECMRGLGMCGGSGYASATVRDDGFERTIGAGVGSKVYRKRGCGQIASIPPAENLNEYPQKFVQGSNSPKLERPVGGAKKKGKGLKELTDDLKKFDLNRVKDYVGLAKPKKGRGLKELTDDLKKFDMNRIKDYVGLAKPPKEMKKVVGQLLNEVQMSRLPKKNLEKVVEKSQMQGVVGGRKPTGKGRSGGAKGMSACGVSGGADGRKARAEIVKKVMAEKGLKMIEASKYVKEHNLYKK